ncbi:MAG TPA: sugar transferase [Thermoanaerobaculia bacterium]|nr:sugar transferase [Thermoanaerobaculia bacterium]
MTYHYDYEIPSRLPAAPRRAPATRRPKGIVFVESTTQCYWFDLSTRRPVAARVKRMIDLALATMLVTLIAPLLLLIIVLIKLTSPGPVIFRQRRIGFRCHQFHMYKFRTMVAGAQALEKQLAREQGTTFLKLTDDPRVTRLGKVLRKYSLDELPQLFNVLEGTMSLVGPRPLLVSDLGTFPRRSQMRRFSMPPGITGLWQVSGRSNCDDRRRMQLDSEYVDRWSLSLDSHILLRTIDVVFNARGAV